MMSVPMIAICVACLVFSIWASSKWNINIGVLALMFSFIIGYWGLDLSLKEIYSGWPANITIMYTTISGMFFCTRKTGTMELLGKKLIYACRKVPGAITIAFALICGFLGAAGADVLSIMALMSVLALRPLHDVGIKPLPAYAAVALGCGMASIWPWTNNGNLISAIMLQAYDQDAVITMTYNVGWRCTLCSMITIIVLIFATKSFKIDENKLILTPPEDFNRDQKKSLWLVFVPVVISIIASLLKTFVKGVPVIDTITGFLQLYVLAFFSICISVIIRLVDGKDLVKNGMPWSTILLSAGMMVFINVMTKGGMTETVAFYMNKSIPETLMLPIFTFAGCILSCFAGATTTAFSLLFFIAVPCAEMTGINIACFVCAILCGTVATGVAPFSTGGATMMANIDLEDWQADNKMVKTAFAVAGLNALTACVLSLLGLNSHFFTPV